MPHPDDLAALKAERDAADRAYNDALTRLDRAIQQLPRDFPQPPPAPDEHQITPLNTLWQIDLTRTGAGIGGRLPAAGPPVGAPPLRQQQAVNAPVVGHPNRSLPVPPRTPPPDPHDPT